VSTLSSANFMVGNILLTERTHKIKNTYARTGVPVHKLGN